MFAAGTDAAPGGFAVINESDKGEIVNLPNGSQVIPHDLSARMTANNNNSTTHIWNIDASGADSGTVERLKSVMAKLGSEVDRQGRAMASAQRFQTTGVG
jgi:phage-related protein